MRMIEGMSHREALHFIHRAQRNGYQADIVGFVMATGESVVRTDVPERTERSIRELYEAKFLRV